MRPEAAAAGLPDLLVQHYHALVRACKDAARSLVGKQHRQFMQTCLKKRERP